MVCQVAIPVIARISNEHVLPVMVPLDAVLLPVAIAILPGDVVISHGKEIDDGCAVLDDKQIVINRKIC